MAKQLVNPIERHLEKGILGVAGLALVGSIVLYVVRTPNRTELAGESVAPSSIDGKIGAKAVEAVGRLRSAPTKTTVPDPLFETYNGSLTPVKAEPLASAVALGPVVPVVDTGGGAGGPAGLAKVLTPGKPTITHGRGTFITFNAAAQKVYIPSDWVSISAVWDVKAQRDAQIREYGPTQPDVVFAPGEIQRRLQRPDGSWSDGDWKDVESAPAAMLPKEPVIRLLADGKTIEVDRDTLKDLDRFKGELAHPNMQLEVLRPLPPEMAPPTKWRFPKITTYREVQMEDEEFLFPNDPPSSDPPDRYGVNPDAAITKAVKQLTPAEQVAKDLTEGEALLESAKRTRSKNDATRAYNRAVTIAADRTVSASDKRRAEALKAAADQEIKDIERERLTKGVNVAPTGEPDSNKPKREKTPAQQVWVHDAGIGSVQNGATYQYRLRFRILNVLAGAPHKFEKPENAAVLFIHGDWSAPCDPVTIEPAVEFYVTGEDSKDREISIDFFRWYLGVWVKPARRMKAGIGDALADRQRVPVPALDDPTAADNAEVEFQADAVVVDVDLDRPIRERRSGSSASGVKFGPLVPSTAAVLVDSEGRLSERWVPVDKNHPGKKEAGQKIWSPTRR